ncbi:hypothetical protein OEZ85_005652 [Tetradesmus obliquus]|uniref:Histone deacetylase complex subunit SAP30 Sin3 binding domain-containing protein n=1 Tax=Tetradesmus obliquus TaxID=3088 RepID=A0ABY8UHT3_TETOB|nr:hypothetical protein OEZ85_005652 [Tetradesmus obliquus]
MKAPLCGESSPSSASSDEVAILPRQTKVIVIGNNRTKRALIGQTAVVKKAVGLGGWHFLVLANGEEVKLQRNALSVVEYGPEDVQDDSSEEMTEAREPQIEILTRPRVRRPPKALSPVPDIFKPSIFKSSSGHFTASTLVDLAKLEVVSLMRYRRVFALAGVGPAAAPEELLQAVSRHFAEQVVEEVQVLTDFRCALKRRSRKQQLMQQQYPNHYGCLQDTSDHRAAAAAAARPLFLGPKVLSHPARQQQQQQQRVQLPHPRALVLDQAMGSDSFGQQQQQQQLISSRY